MNIPQLLVWEAAGPLSCERLLRTTKHRKGLKGDLSG